MSIRPPAVAGAFYPGVAPVLEADVARLLADAEPPAGRGALVKALIVPHAGYPYSGPVAASAYALLRDGEARVRRVVLLGPAHRVPVRGLAASGADAFETPLGVVPLDREGLEALRDLPQVVVSDEAHAAEHSLEVQLPFLQRVLGDFVLLPLVVGDASDEEVAEALERVWGGDETLILISSDLSHYHDYATARSLDAATCRAIERLDAAAVDWESACGRVPVRGLLGAARRHGLEPRTLDLRSSGDTAGDRDRVVGYGAWAFELSGEEAADAEADQTDGAEALHAAAARELFAIARRAIEQGLDTGGEPAVHLDAVPRPLRAPGASFVTLRSPDGELRGCIGSLEAERPLAADVARNAFASAFRDPRMTPIARDELADLHIEISILTPRQEIPARSLDEQIAALRPGEVGLVLEDAGRRGTLLPQVWSQLPQARDFAGTVWRKAGLPEQHWSPTARAWRYTVRRLDEQDAGGEPS